LHDTVQACGAEVVLQPPQPGLPDLVFTANAALISGGTAYLAQFACPERQPERAWNRAFFQEQGFRLLGEDAEQAWPDFEGAGDALFAGDQLFVAHGFRSDPRVGGQLAACYSDKVIHQVRLVDPYFYHLDTCFCPLDAERALLWPGALTEASVDVLQRSLNTYAVPEAEARSFACNAVVLGAHVILPSGCPQTTAWLESEGFRVHACALGEFLKAGGSAKCLTLRLT
jgi:N-dimethylarginine dimethylaminohydrolase